MKLYKKIYCRTIQTGLRAALPILPYRKPEVFSSIEKILPVLEENKINSVLLITDKGIRGHKITEPLELLLQKQNIRCTVYDDTCANPTDQNAEEAYELYCKNNCQALIGFGGGSSMDCAKAVGVRIARPNKRLADMEGVLKVHHKLPPLIAIPTTAGTGSEVTLAAVVTDAKTHHKYPITDFCLIPKYAVLDPEVTRSLPPFITACTAMDALTHAIEAYIGRSTNSETRSDATRAVQLIFENIERAYENGNDISARRNLLQAAFLAGNAFSKSYVGYVHAIAHSLSGKYNLPHGFTNAVLLPWVLEAYGPVIHKKLAKLAVAAGLSKESDSPSFGAAALIRAIRQLNLHFGIPERIPEIRREDIPELAKTADKEANPLYPVPVLWDNRELEGFYETVREGFYETARNTANHRTAESLLCKGADIARTKPAFGSAKS